MFTLNHPDFYPIPAPPAIWEVLPSTETVVNEIELNFIKEKALTSTAASWWKNSCQNIRISIRDFMIFDMAAYCLGTLEEINPTLNPPTYEELYKRNFFSFFCSYYRAQDVYKCPKVKFANAAGARDFLHKMIDVEKDRLSKEEEYIGDYWVVENDIKLDWSILDEVAEKLKVFINEIVRD